MRDSNHRSSVPTNRRRATLTPVLHNYTYRYFLPQVCTSNGCAACAGGALTFKKRLFVFLRRPGGRKFHELRSGIRARRELLGAPFYARRSYHTVQACTAAVLLLCAMYACGRVLNIKPFSLRCLVRVLYTAVGTINTSVSNSYEVRRHFTIGTRWCLIVVVD